MKDVRKDLVESISIDSLYNDLFSDSAIQQSKIINNDIYNFKKELKEIDKQLNNMAEAIANEFYNSAMKTKSEELESRRNTLIIRLNEAEREAALNTPNIDMIKQY
jgi:site-specific DNA recombinase